MALVSGGRSTLNPDAPLFIPAVFRQVEDFSPEWWELVKTSTWFQAYWLSEHQEEDMFDGNDEDDIANYLPESIDLDEDFSNLEVQLEDFVQYFDAEDANEAAYLAFQKGMTQKSVDIDMEALLKSQLKSPKERGSKSPALSPKFLEKPVKYMEMETIHAKLYEKYDKLKTRKFSEFEQSGRDQEEKFVDYVSTAEELIEHLRSENNKLKAQLSELHDEVNSTKSSIIECQKHLNEECQKTKALTKEVERLQNLQQETVGAISGASPYNLRKRKGNSDSVHSSGGTRVVSEDTSTGSLRKKKRLQDATNQPYDTNQLNLSVVSGSDQNSHGGYLPEDNQGLQHEKSSLRKPLLSGHMGADFMLQTLMESLSGLKFEFDQEAERLCLHAVHPSSGYSFSLKWLSKAAEEDAELMYQVFSLGTIQRVALEWMKEDIVFSLSMFPTFLWRVSKVLGLQLGCT
ncbi:Early responsive to dehydration [Thalictrum thalictroides]|uniref:Early responsive to dehydration n=1 Tax=Thalictrum thalictroides TaxID=46969 RepID=A0A7J6VAR4_THATH|nr:Early responsive to dehydration [Thalictrum thalictroides]